MWIQDFCLCCVSNKHQEHEMKGFCFLFLLLSLLISPSRGAIQTLSYFKRSPLRLFPKGRSSSSSILINSVKNIRGGDNFFSSNEFGRDDTSSSIISSISERYLKTPPISRLFMTSSLFITLFSFFFKNNRWPEILSMNWEALSRFQIWRIITGFLYFGPFGINYLLTLQFLWQYMSQIEKLYFNQPERFLVLLGFGAGSLLLSYLYFGLSTQYLGHNLCAYLVYIWSRVFEGVPVNLMGLATVPAEILPWLFCLQSVLIDGYIPWTDFLGIIAGHLFLLSEKSGWINPPSALVKWARSPFVRKIYRKYSPDFE